MPPRARRRPRRPPPRRRPRPPRRRRRARPPGGVGRVDRGERGGGRHPLPGDQRRHRARPARRRRRPPPRPWPRAPRPDATRTPARVGTATGRRGRSRAGARRAGWPPAGASTTGGGQQLVECAALGEAVAHERLVRGVLQQPTHQVRHARHQLADGRVDPQPQPEAAHRRVHGLGHAVEHLDLVAGVGDALVPRVGDGVGQRAQVVAAERGADRAVVVVQQPDAALVVGVGRGLVLEHRHRPALGPGVDGLRVPVRPLHQSHGDRLGPARRPGDEVGQVVAAVAEVRLDHDARGQVGELVLGQQVAEERERQVLGVVVLHVDVDERAALAGEPQDRPQPLLGPGQAHVAAERLVVGGQRGRLDADVDPGQRARGRRARGGRRAPSRRCAEARAVTQLGHPGGVAVGLGGHHRLLAQHVDRERAAAPPQPVCSPSTASSGVAPTMNCCGHAQDVAPRHAGLDPVGRTAPGRPRRCRGRGPGARRRRRSTRRRAGPPRRRCGARGTRRRSGTAAS